MPARITTHTLCAFVKYLDGHLGNFVKSGKMKPSFVISALPDKGLGVVAIRKIELGELIIAEAPLFILPWWIRHSQYPLKELRKCLDRAMDELTDEEEEAFYALSDCKTEGDEDKTELGIWRTNNFALGRSNSKSRNGIFPKLSRFNHSCAPSAEFSWNESDNRQEIRAIRDIEAGDEICVCYFTTNVQVMGREDRRAYLQSHYGFLCDCKACSLPRPHNEADDDMRAKIKSLAEKLNDLLYEWVDLSSSSSEEEETDGDVTNADLRRALHLATERLDLMEKVGFKYVSRMDACDTIVSVALDISDIETASKYCKRGQDMASVLYGPGSRETLTWKKRLPN